VMREMGRKTSDRRLMGLVGRREGILSLV
jgi:hypothetical protein